MTKPTNTPAALCIEHAKRIAWLQSLPDLPLDPHDNICTGWAYAWPDEDEEEFPEIESGWADDFGDDEGGV
jgi:hypothetical protein